MTPNFLLQRIFGVKGCKFSLTLKAYLFATALILFGSSLTAAALYHVSLVSMREEIAAKLTSLAATAAVTLDAEKLKLIRQPADEGTANYRELQQKLQQIQSTSFDKLRYLYVIAKRGKSFVYILDATPVDAKDHSATGEVFPIKCYPQALVGFQQPTVEPKPIPDSEFGGISQSGYAPIRDASGETVAVVGIDMDVSKIETQEKKIWAGTVQTFIASLLLALLLGLTVSFHLTNPILKVVGGIQRISDGDFDTQIVINQHDELGLLAQSFNKMAIDLKNAKLQLTRMNQELEKKVALRTAELSETNQAISEILDNMEEGVLTVGPDLTVNPQYSHFAGLIFESGDIAGKRIDDLLFPGYKQNELKTQLAGWLSLIFELPVVIWSNVEQIQPVSELTIAIKLPDSKVKQKDLQLRFRPVFSDQSGSPHSKIEKIMVIIQDNTEKKKLKREVETKTKEYQDNINDIIEVIQLDQDLFIMFVNDCKDQLSNFEPRLIQLQSHPDNLVLINDLLRVAHTLKGNATQFKLERIATKIHEIEIIFRKIRDREVELDDHLLSDIFDKLDRTQLYLREIEAAYFKYISGKKRDVAQIRSEERNQEEVSIVRVKMEELDQLIALVHQGAALDAELNNLEDIRKVLIETENKLTRMRRVSLGRLFTRFPRMVKEIAAELGKNIDLHLEGEDIVIDRVIFDKIGDPLIHIVRNALDHGIETPEERIRQSKPVRGNIDIRAQLSGQELTITIRDDGRGIDLEHIRNRAVAKGFISKDEAMRMTEAEIVNLVYIPGFSTADQLTKISGQGVGMDVVRTSLNGLGGTVQLTTIKNQGTQLVLVIPIKNK